MLATIVKFELRYILRNPLVWLTAAVIVSMFFIAMNVEGFELGSEGGLFRNAAYATLRNYLMISVIFMFVTTSFVANVILRDDDTGFGPIIRSTQITKFEYVIGRYLGAFAVAALLTMLVTLGMIVGSLMPWADPSSLGPNRLADHLYGFFVIALPNILVHSAILFALATITRSMMATYLGVIAFVTSFLTLQGAFDDRPQLQTVLALAEPFASRALEETTRYWTVAERNMLLPEFSGALLLNRLLWIAIALLFLGGAYARYRFADRGMSKRELRKQRLGDAAHAPHTVRPDEATGPLRQNNAASLNGALPSPRPDNAALRSLLWLRTRFEATQVLVSPAFPVLMVWGLFTTVFVLLTQRYPDFRPEYPTTLSLIPEIEDAFRMIPMIVAIYYAGELVWRERDRRVHELIDASPLPSWAYVISKTAALALLFVAMLLVNVIAAVALQLSLGFNDVELGKYLLWYVLPASFDSLLLAAAAIFIQSLSPHKAVGWGIMVLLVVWRELNQWVQHTLLNYAQTPQVPLSDLNGAGTFWIGGWTVRLYWGAFAVLLLVLAHLLWRRGTDVRLRPRLALARRRLTGAPGWLACAALLTFAATGAYAYYNTNVLNEYGTWDDAELSMVEYERRFGKYRGIAQPSLEELTLDVAIHPNERRAVAKGRFLLRNATKETIPEFHVRLLDGEELELTNLAIPGSRLMLDDSAFHYRIYRLDRPMQPGETRVLTFETRRWSRGFRSGAQEVRLVENGTFLTESEVLPTLGMIQAGMLLDPELRRKHGLPGEIRPPKLEDLSATMTQSFGDGWIRKADITLSTDADQTPIAPGKKVSDVTRGRRRTARFVSTVPIRPRFSIQSARYAEKHRQHRGVDLAVYYHPRHAWNVDRMLDAAAISLDVFEEAFGPYPLDHFRIVEFPGYNGYAQAFAGTIPFSESVGFIADYNEPDTLDYVTGITAHELAHQWWAHQLLGAEMEGRLLLSETLAQYSAHLVIKKLRGEDQIRRYMQYELDRYLGGRAWQEEEPALVRVLGEDHIAYRKGAMAMYLLQKRLGEDAVNRALKKLLERYKFQGAPYPRSLDLVAALRAEAKTDEDQNLITDLFERITLYDLRVAKPSAVRRADGRWDVTVPVLAKKHYADAKGAETETPFQERIEIGLFTAEPGRDAFDPSDLIVMERHPIRSGEQVLRFVTDVRPTFAGVDPYNFYIDRNSADNVTTVE